MDTSILALIISSVLSNILTIGVIFWYAKRYVEEQKAELIDDVKEYMNTESFQKNVYAIGALIGAGAKGGIGLNKGGGKFGMNDLIMQIAGSFLGNKFGIGQQTQQAEQPQQQSNNENLKFPY